MISFTQEGAILIFVPGWAQISDVNKKLQARTTSTSGLAALVCLVISQLNCQPNGTKLNVFF